ncbi:MAG TPA: septum formation family protein [Candidatus Limnocylindrales bacterium]|nr:septum formation family protein [Candidatus Limnocylindrales bacterium]
MRIVGILLAATLTLAACSRGEGGGLTDHWSRMADPASWRPQAGTCHYGFEPRLMRSAYDPVDCADDHRFETVHVGQFGGEVPASEPPAESTPQFRSAWADCDARATAYLGGQWRDRQVRVAVSMPAPQGWKAGSRWYMCLLGPVEWTGNRSTVLDQSLKGRYASLPVLEWGCGDQPDSGEFKPTDCREPHDTEFVGSFSLDMSYAAVKARYDANDPLFHRECLKLIAGFVGVSGAAKLPRGTGSSYWLPDGADWEAGDRSVRCFLWIDGGAVSGSLRNAGTGGLTRG